MVFDIHVPQAIIDKYHIRWTEIDPVRMKDKIPKPTNERQKTEYWHQLDWRKKSFFNDLEIMNRKFNTRQTDDFVNLTQYLLIFSQRKKSRTHSCLHNGKKPIGQWIILKVHCQVVAKFIRMTNGQFGVQFWHLPTFPLLRPVTWRFTINSNRETTISIYIIHLQPFCLHFVSDKEKNTDLKLVLKSAQFFRPS